MTLSLDSPEWTSLHHAYGGAGDVPEMLRDLEEKPSEKSWEAIWSALCHQGDTYSATYAAIPHVYRLASTRDPEDQIEYLSFIGAVASDTSGNPRKIPEELRGDYSEAVRSTKTLILDLLTKGPKDERTAVYLLQFLAGCNGCSGLGQFLDGINEGEIPLTCPGCSSDIRALIDEDAVYLTVEEPERETVRVRSPVIPPGVSEPSPNLDIDLMPSGEAKAWLPRAANLSGYPKLSSQIRLLFGTGECPKCANSFNLAEEVERFGKGGLDL